MANRATRRRVDLRFTARCPSLKVGYGNHAAAWDAAELAMLRDEASPGCHMMAYACTDCTEWHIANKRIVPVNITIRTINEINRLRHRQYT